MGSYLDRPKTEKSTTPVIKTKRLAYAATSMQGWRVNMEDSHITFHDEQNDLYIFGVFDGHGGKQVSRFSQNHFLEVLFSTQAFKEKNFSQALTETFYQLDELLLLPEYQDELKMLAVDPDEENNNSDNEEDDDENVTYAGSTANVILISGVDLYIANVGDSRSALCEDGTFIELSIDHKPDLMQEKQRILQAEGNVINGRVNGDLSVSRALGDFEFKSNENLSKDEQLVIVKPEITHRKLTENSEFILIGCDGIWETKKTEVIMKFLRNKIQEKKYSLRAIIELLLDELIAKYSSERFGLDNMTGIIVQFRKPGEVENEHEQLIDEIEKKVQECKLEENPEEKNKKEIEFRSKMDAAMTEKYEKIKKKNEEKKV